MGLSSLRFSSPMAVQRLWSRCAIGSCLLSGASALLVFGHQTPCMFCSSFEDFPFP